MHVGCNLRKAFLVGVKNAEDQGIDCGDGKRECHQVDDTFVHECLVNMVRMWCFTVP